MKALIFVGPAETGKTRVATLLMQSNPNAVYIAGKNWKNSSPFNLSSVESTTKTLIIDDVAEDFNYQTFFHIADNDAPYNYKYRIRVEKKGSASIIVEIENLIITTNKINKEILKSDSFKRRFDLIYFSKEPNFKL